MGRDEMQRSRRRSCSRLQTAVFTTAGGPPRTIFALVNKLAPGAGRPCGGDGPLRSLL